MRRAARVDGNHREVVEALEAHGCQVLSMASLGKGVADLLVLQPNRCLRLLEVKDGSKPPSKRRLTRAQQDWHKVWPVRVVESAADAVFLCTGEVMP